MVNKYWATDKVFVHMRKVQKEFRVFPNDGSIELEIEECKDILRRRGIYGRNTRNQKAG